MAAKKPFWETVPLAAMTREQWESLCDGCGRCCLHKVREDDGTLHFTNVACRLLDNDTGLCSDYVRRRRRVPDCVQLTPAAVAAIDWLPPSCAYRLLAEGESLPDWHPLISGRPGTVQAAGASVRGRTVSESVAGPLEHHIVDWPGRVPPRKRSGPRVRVRQVSGP